MVSNMKSQSSFWNAQLFEADERHALLIVNQSLNTSNSHLPYVLKDLEAAKNFADRHDFTSITVLKDKDATKENVEKSF